MIVYGVCGCPKIPNTKYQIQKVPNTYQILSIEDLLSVWLPKKYQYHPSVPQESRTGCPLTYIIIFPQFIFVIIVIVVNLATVTLWDMLDTLLSRASN